MHFDCLHFSCCFVDCHPQKANQFDPDVVLNQLRYSGMLETVKIRRAGFPVRRTFQDFYSRSAKYPKNTVQHEADESSTHYLIMSDEWGEKSAEIPNICINRYKLILNNKIPSDDEKQNCSELLTLHDKAKTEWQLGKTKVEHTHRYTLTHMPQLVFVI